MLRYLWWSSSGRMANGSSIWTAMSSIERKMKLMKTIATSKTGSSASGLSSHHVPIEKSAKVRESAKGSSVIHIQRKRTEERVYLWRVRLAASGDAELFSSV